MDYRIIQYLKGELNEEQKRELADWINSDVDNRRHFEEFEDAWYASSISQTDLFNADKAYTQHRHQLRSNFSVRSISFLKYAATILILISLGWIGHLVFNNIQSNASVAFMSFSVPNGETAYLELADQTMVQLNSGSSIRVPETCKKGIREVFLNGEAYFEVAKNKDRPFVVHTDSMDIKVLGTSFNVKSYPGENRVETTVEEGLVQVSYNSKGKNDATTVLLAKGQYASFDSRSKSYEFKDDINTQLYTSWKQGAYKFQKVKLQELIKSIERIYNVNISIEKYELGNLTYSGSFYKDEPVENVLKMVEQSSLGTKIQKTGKDSFLIVGKK